MPDDNDLFQEATSTETTLDKFENPELPLDPPPEQPKPEPAAEKPADPIQPKEEALVPAHRLREESEARRQAERRYEELLARQAQQAAPPPPKPPQTDIFDNPAEFIQQQVKPYLEQLYADNELTREELSREAAIYHFGPDKVKEAYDRLAEGITRQDPYAVYAYNQARSSRNPYGVIMRWHQQAEALREVGPDPKAYRAKTEEELLSDPAHLQKALERARSQAQSANNNVARPVRTPASSSPSLGDIGSGAGGDQSIAEPTDEQLFRAATTAKRR